MTNHCQTQRLTFVRFDERFLEKSWHWLQDPEIKRLTMTPDFDRQQQRRWFEHLPLMDDYRIWGLMCEHTPIGAVGLKHVVKGSAEYWGYIGERDYWGAGLGSEMMGFVLDQAKRLELRELHLAVHKDNARAIALYTKHGFLAFSQQDGVLQMQLRLDHYDV